MRKFIGVTSHVMYFLKFTNIVITPERGHSTIKIYVVPTEMKCDPDSIDITKIDNVWTKEMYCENINTKYDASGYENGKNKNENFKLLVNGECAHKSQYAQKYLIEFDGSFVLTEVPFVDH